MRETFMLANSLLFLCLWGLGLALFYFVIKAAVKNGVEQANTMLVESVRAIERSVMEIKMEANKKESK